MVFPERRRKERATAIARSRRLFAALAVIDRPATVIEAAYGVDATGVPRTGAVKLQKLFPIITSGALFYIRLPG